METVNTEQHAATLPQLNRPAPDFEAVTTLG